MLTSSYRLNCPYSISSHGPVSLECKFHPTIDTFKNIHLKFHNQKLSYKHFSSLKNIHLVPGQLPASSALTVSYSPNRNRCLNSIRWMSRNLCDKWTITGCGNRIWKLRSRYRRPKEKQVWLWLSMILSVYFLTSKLREGPPLLWYILPSSHTAEYFPRPQESAFILAFESSWRTLELIRASEFQLKAVLPYLMPCQTERIFCFISEGFLFAESASSFEVERLYKL